MIEWKPIKTAPKDGRPVLLWDAEEKWWYVAMRARRALRGHKKPCLSFMEDRARWEDIPPCYGGTELEDVSPCYEGTEDDCKCPILRSGVKWRECRFGAQSPVYPAYQVWRRKWEGWLGADGLPLDEQHVFTHWAELDEPEVTNDKVETD